MKCLIYNREKSVMRIDEERVDISYGEFCICSVRFIITEILI